MKILRVIVDELPEYCQLCTYHKGETYSFVANVCTLIDKVVEVEQLFEKSYPDWCPLVSKGQIQKLIVTPSYDNAWDMVSFVLGIAGESESE